jgi:PTH1 family peptidyl-tRNA hydrolase
MILIIGLGNPGRHYYSNRHNIGYIIADRFAFQAGAPDFRQKFQSEHCRITYLDTDIIILKPLTFMNNSGRSVAKFFKYYRDKITGLLVLHDDLDVEFGTIKFKRGGSSGGHNGLESIINTLGDTGFDRLRFGIGRPPAGEDPADFVLKNFNRAEEKELPYLVEKSLNALKDYISGGVENAMNLYNRQNPDSSFK